jgi:hypothetical protein
MSMKKKVVLGILWFLAALVVFYVARSYFGSSDRTVAVPDAQE